ncbi:MAG: hypothetical protein E7680_03090 [Ruminococcaceae bacterium]|nr:hypothetical protein [Oscillospiraceae bacterium]
MNRSHVKKTNRKNNTSFHPVWKSVLLAFGIAAGIGAILILLASLIANLTPDPGRLIRPFAIVAASLTYLAAGMVAAGLRPDAPLAAGTVNGLVLSAVFLAISLFFRKSVSPLPVYATALLHAGMILLSLLGAYLFVLKKAKQPRKKKRKHG